MKNIKKAVAFLLTAAVLMLAVVPAFAADANVIYSGNAGKFIFTPGSAYSLTDLFPNFKDVMPGDSITQLITVRNDADNKVKVEIYMRSLGPADEKYRDFLSKLNLTVTKAEKTPMFDAAADRTDGLTEWVCLGTLYSGGKVDLNVTLDVPTSLDNNYQKLVGKINWEFRVEEFDISPDDPSPHTGDEPMILIICVAAICLSALVMWFIIAKRKRDEETEERVAD